MLRYLLGTDLIYCDDVSGTNIRPFLRRAAAKKKHEDETVIQRRFGHLWRTAEQQIHALEQGKRRAVQLEDYLKANELKVELARLTPAVALMKRNAANGVLKLSMVARQIGQLENELKQAERNWSPQFLTAKKLKVEIARLNEEAEQVLKEYPAQAPHEEL